MEEQVRQLVPGASAESAAAEETADVGVDAPRPARRPRSPKHPPCSAGASSLPKAPNVVLAAAIAGCVVACGILRFAPGAEVAAVLSICAVLVLLGALLLLQRRVKAAFSTVAADCARARQLAKLNSSVVESFAMAIDAKDQHTQGHTERVRDMAVAIGEEKGLTEDALEALRTASMLHDIGKLAVPDYILSKPAQLTEEEMKKVQTHTLVGAAILEPVKFPWPVVPIVRSHHEWYNGTGYPDGLAGDSIPLGALILAVADVYDALLSHRPYRPAMTVQQAVAFMRERSGTQFDPEILRICFRILSAQKYRHRFGFIFDGDSEVLRLGTGGTPDQQAVFMDIRQAHQELLALYEIVQTMGQSLNVQETLDLIISKTKRIVDFSTCVLFLIQPDDGQLVAVAAAGPYAEAVRGRRLPMGSGVSGSVALSGQPSGLGAPAGEDLLLLLGPSARECALAHALSAPLVSEEGTVGTLTLYRTADRPFDADDARLVGAVGRQAAMAIKNARKYEQTRQSALTDQLTGLFNARYFFMQLQQELSRAERERQTFSLVACDLNNLKQVNDQYGHQQGDRVLKIMAEVFNRHLREYDTCVRYAGDEFFVILPNTTNQEAAETVSRIKQALRDTSIEMLPGRFVSLSASFGVATYPGDAKEADALIAVADEAMYSDKRLTRQAVLLSGGETGGRGERKAEAGKSVAVKSRR